MRESESETDESRWDDAPDSRRELVAGALTVASGVALAALGTSLIDSTPSMDAMPIVVASILAGSLLLPGAVVAWWTETVTPLSVAASGVLVALLVLGYATQTAGLAEPLYWSTRDSVAAVALAALPFLLGPQFVDREPFRQV